MSSKSSPTTAIVIPNWNGADMIGACIDSLLTQTVPVTIVVVENGSVDNSMDVLKMYGDKIVILPQKRNLGFAGGVNRGIEYALEHDYTYVGLLNNDAVADSRWVEELLKGFGVSSEVKIVASKMLQSNKALIDTIGSGYTIFGSPFPRGRNEVDKGQYDTPMYVFGASGGAGMYTCALFKDIGFFDEDFFAYYEEDDINFRAALAGYKAYVEPKAIVYHAIGGTSGKLKGFTSFQTAKNFWFLFIKNMPMPLFLLYLPLALWWYFLMFINRTLHGHILYFIRGWFSSLRYTATTWKKRQYIQAHKRVTYKTIDAILYHGVRPKVKQ